MSRRTDTLFSVAIFANAALLFSLEPMFGKMVLPALGGSAMVWTTCLLFFQAALLAGYLYARLLDCALSPRWQPVAHIVLVIAAGAVLPFSIPAAWRATNETQPIWSLLMLLARRVGPPFIVLSAGAPLIQRWFAATRACPTRTPYSLYAVSNVGSIAALLAYPFLVEPHFHLSTQASTWTFGYAALLGLFVILALALRSSTAAPAPTVPVRSSTRSRQRALWIALAAAPSSLLLGVTTHLTTDLAPIPLLWVVPLVLYLLSFVVAFSERGVARGIVRGARLMLPYAVISVAVLAFLDSELPGALGYGVHCVSLFVCALACHARLVDAKPPERELTSFYLWLALGGALGGVFNAIIAPLVFTGVAEYPIALVAAASLSGEWLSPGRRRDVVIGAGSAAIVVCLAWALARTAGTGARIGVPILVGLVSIAVFSFRSRPLRFALGTASLFLGAFAALDAGTHADFRARSFYGVYRVVDDSSSGMRRLFSGTTVHGSELFADAANTPLAYYHRKGPVGSLFALLGARPRLRVAIIGLGAGSMAAYSRPSDSWTFYEIDPLVARIALDTARFHFLGAAAARPSIVLGDARLSLERASPRAFDVIVIDAFSSDAIPVHLLTREAVALYRSRLADHGVIAWHISNRYLDLRPVVAALAQDAGLTAVVDADLTVAPAYGGRSPSIWVVMTPDHAVSDALSATPWWRALLPAQASLCWTDDFSGVASLLRVGR